MNTKMTAFKNVVQCYKSNSLLIKENRKNSYFANDKTCHYAENMSFFGNLDNVLKLLCKAVLTKKSQVHLLLSNILRQKTHTII